MINSHHQIVDFLVKLLPHIRQRLAFNDGKRGDHEFLKIACFKER